MLPANVERGPYIPGPRVHLRRLAYQVSGYYRVRAHLPRHHSAPLALENLLLAAQMPCSAPHAEEDACPDCQRLLTELIAAVRQQDYLCIQPIVAETIAQIESGETAQPPVARASSDSPTRRAAALLPVLRSYQATLHRPCDTCGSLLWYERHKRFYCFLCAPLPHFPESLRASLVETCAVP